MPFQPLPPDPDGSGALARYRRAGPVGTAAPEYELRRLVLPRGTSRSAARQLLTDSAEHDGWELARLSLFSDGTRRVTLRRRIIRARRTLDGLLPTG